MAAADFDRTMAVTFGGTVNLVRELLPELRRTRGALVIVGSVTAQLPVPDMAPYVAAKHALRGFSNSLRLELRRDHAGVEVTYLKPGHISTALWERSTSATGARLRLPPLSYRLEEVVDEIERAVGSPGGETTVGAASRAQVVAFQLARPACQATLRWASRFAATAHRAPSPGSLWEPAPVPRLRGTGTRGRPSLLGAVRRWSGRRGGP